MAVEVTTKIICDGCGRKVIQHTVDWHTPPGWDYGSLVKSERQETEEELAIARKFKLKTGVRFTHLCPECLGQKRKGGGTDERR